MKKGIKLDIYTDGACSGNPGKGGWSFVVTNGTEKLKSFSGGESSTTNNRMELTAIVEALKYVEKRNGTYCIDEASGTIGINDFDFFSSSDFWGTDSGVVFWMNVECLGHLSLNF